MSKSTRGDGWHAARINKGHPERQARRDRAVARAAEHVCTPDCKRYRTGRVVWEGKS